MARRSGAAKPVHHLGVEALPENVDESLADRQREVRIEQLVADYTRLAGFGNVSACMDTWKKLQAEILARSPAQVERMERRMGLKR